MLRRLLYLLFGLTITLLSDHKLVRYSPSVKKLEIEILRFVSVEVIRHGYSF